MLSHAFHDKNYNAPRSEANPVFSSTIVSSTELTTTNQNLVIKRDISFTQAHADLASYDVLVIPGGGSSNVLTERTEPISLITAFFNLPPKKDGSTRYILSVCTGSLFLGEAGILKGLSATTHFDFYDRLREITGGNETKVLEERFVVNRKDEERGVRVITAGGVSCGLDACLWLIGEVVGEEIKESAANVVQ